MATTGELPPNASKGQNFVHNPRANDAPEVKGQIRLVFKTPQQTVLALRNFQLSNSKDKRGKLKTSYKALDSVVQVKTQDGVTKSLNRKCAAMDTQVPRMMGVSKAILENVVFCHQEESNWPLGEMPKLKKKFDDLFGATRYSKALEAINNARKEHQKICKDKLHDLEMSTAYMEQAKSLRSKIDEVVKRNTVLNDTINDLKEVLDEKTGQSDSIRNRLEQMKQLETDVAVRHCLIDAAKTEAERLRLALPAVMDENLTGVRERLSWLRSQLQTNESSLSARDKLISSLDSELLESANNKNKLQQQATEATRAEVHLKEAIRQREQIEEKVRSRFQLTLKLESADLQLKALRGQQEKELEEVETRGKRRLKQLTESQSEARNQVAKAQSELTSTQATISRFQEEISECRSKLIEESSIKSQLELVGNTVAALEETQRRSTRDQKITELETDIVQLRAQRQNLSRCIEDASNRITSQEALSVASHQLDAELQLREAKRNKIENSVDELRSIYPSLVKNNDLESVVAQAAALTDEIRSAEAALLRAEQIRTNRGEEVGNVAGKLEMIRSKCAQMKAQKIKLLDEIHAAGLQLENFYEVLQKQRDHVAESQREMLTAGNAKMFNENHLSKSLRRKKCTFCSRAFKTDEEIETFTRQLTNRIEEIPLQSKKFEQDFENAKKHLAELDHLQAGVAQVESLSLELRDREAEETKLQSEAARLRSALEKANCEVDAENKKCAKLKEVLIALKALQLEMEELDKIENNIAKLQEELADKSNGESLPDGRAEIRRINQQMRENEEFVGFKETELAMLRKSKAAQQVEANQMCLKKQMLENEISRLNEIRRHLESNEEALAKLSDSLKLLKEEAQAANKRAEEIQVQHQAVLQEHSLATEKLRRSVEELRSFQDDWRRISQEIAETQRVQMGATAVQETIKQLEAKDAQLAQQAQAERSASAACRLLIAQLHTQMEKVETNLRLKEKEEELKELRASLEVLLAGQQEGCRDVHGMRKDFESLSKEISQLSHEISSKQGEQKSNHDFLAQHQLDLQAAKFKNIEQQHRCSLIDCETELMVTRDLRKYYSALDKALMRYHTIKMQQINHSIRQLWQRIYKGIDIDYIAIRSDTEEDLQFASTGQRSYNYRVTMVKDGLEAEMRGRCSAGQKVLASIVIRLALAESFCVECGILTLDEPTTNLDVENMEGFARAIADLIEDRRSCRHFQLILITHDENFVRMLSRHQPCDFYFKVYKDSQGYSRIKRKDIRVF